MSGVLNETSCAGKRVAVYPPSPYIPPGAKLWIGMVTAWPDDASPTLQFAQSPRCGPMTLEGAEVGAVVMYGFHSGAQSGRGAKWSSFGLLKRHMEGDLVCAGMARDIDARDLFKTGPGHWLKASEAATCTATQAAGVVSRLPLWRPGQPLQVAAASGRPVRPASLHAVEAALTETVDALSVGLFITPGIPRHSDPQTGRLALAGLPGLVRTITATCARIDALAAVARALPAEFVHEFIESELAYRALKSAFTREERRGRTVAATAGADGAAPEQRPSHLAIDEVHAEGAA